MDTFSRNPNTYSDTNLDPDLVSNSYLRAPNFYLYSNAFLNGFADFVTYSYFRSPNFHLYIYVHPNVYTNLNALFYRHAHNHFRLLFGGCHYS